jgi:hypothetical protein
MGNAVARLRRHWFLGLSSEIKASIDGRLIHNREQIRCQGRRQGDRLHEKAAGWLVQTLASASAAMD